MAKRKLDNDSIVEESQTKKTKGESIANKFEEIFADPTYDITFKMLFANDKYKHILISLLNSFLGFEGTEKEIQEVEINSPDLQQESISGVKGAVDVLCTTTNKKKIAVEMQRTYKEYFLPRTQEYMSKIIAQQVLSGESAKYHEVMLDTYVLAIGKKNIFYGEKYKIQGTDNFFEKTVVPTIVETAEEVPGNKMHWKFFELPRFAKEYSNLG